jgi:plastocyanin
LIGVTAACGGSESDLATTTSASSGAGASGATSATGGAGASATSASTGGTGGAPCVDHGTAFDAYNGCVPGELEDMTCMSNVEVKFGFIDSKFKYVPACIVVSAGTTVTFTAADGTNFQIHSLQGGTAQGGLKPDNDSPIVFTNDSNLKSKSFVFSDAGSYPYYCVPHALQGMVGAVYVDGPLR